MTTRLPRLVLTIFVVSALSACAAGGGGDDKSGDVGGTIEMAVSELCTDQSDPQCVDVNGENVLLPTSFDQAEVSDASVAENGLNAVDVTFTEDGAKILHTLTESAVEAGDQARLVIRIGGDIKTAVVVMEALTGDEVQLALSPGDSPQEIVDLIQQG